MVFLSGELVEQSLSSHVVGFADGTTLGSDDGLDEGRRLIEGDGDGSNDGSALGTTEG